MGTIVKKDRFMSMDIMTGKCEVWHGILEGEPAFGRGASIDAFGKWYAWQDSNLRPTD